ncbi:diacylglycerol kinase [Roseovarius arcticus]|uniref:diacylglycerol kinase n=1 Tax=Roseovarius arcticus TaxID=2547404 RepID=UPI001BB2AE3B
MVEVLNTAIESIVDRISLERHPPFRRSQGSWLACSVTRHGQCYDMAVICYFIFTSKRQPDNLTAGRRL